MLETHFPDRISADIEICPARRQHPAFGVHETARPVHKVEQVGRIDQNAHGSVCPATPRRAQVPSG